MVVDLAPIGADRPRGADYLYCRSGVLAVWQVCAFGRVGDGDGGGRHNPLYCATAAIGDDVDIRFCQGHSEHTQLNQYRLVDGCGSCGVYDFVWHPQS